jgi:hypothetical protein
MTLSVLLSSDGKQYAWVARGIQPYYESVKDRLHPPLYDTPVAFLVQFAVFILPPLGLLIVVVLGIWSFLTKRKA